MKHKYESPFLPRILRVFLCVLCVFAVSSLSAEPIYQNDFEKTPDGAPPGDVAILGGDFKVSHQDANKFIELPGDPVDGYGFLFGPDAFSLLGVSARIQTTATGKRTPEFGIGLADTAGYKLWVMPAKNELQILKGEEVKATVPFIWKSGTWTSLHLEVIKTADGKHLIQGKAWEHGLEEPKDWAVKFEENGELPKGRASAWGSPYAGTPIRFDDLKVVKTGEE